MRPDTIVGIPSARDLLMDGPEASMGSTLRAVHTIDRSLELVRNPPRRRAGVRIAATTDHDEIRRWAARHGAEPSTGQATTSGPETLDVNDGGAGIRFNFPG